MPTSRQLYPQIQFRTRNGLGFYCPLPECEVPLYVTSRHVDGLPAKRDARLAEHWNSGGCPGVLALAENDGP